MMNFRTWLAEAGGQSSGAVELLDMTTAEARAMATEILGDDLMSEIKGFNRNFELAQQMVLNGWTKRKDMPVIDNVESFKNAIELGHIDLDTGKFDSSSYVVNRVNIDNRTYKAKDLFPIQKQIYLDKALKSLQGQNLETSKYFLQTTKFVSSYDEIIDGHHRWLTAILVNPEMDLSSISFQMSIEHLLPLAVGYSDSIGNKRNK